MNLLFWIAIGIFIAFAGQLAIKFLSHALKDVDVKKVVGVTAYYGQGIWFSLLNGIVASIANASVKPLLSILYNPFEYYDLQLTCGDFWIGLVGFVTWFMTVFMFYYTLTWKVAEALGVKKRSHAVLPAMVLTLLFMYAFGFRATIALIVFNLIPYLFAALLIVGFAIIFYALAS